MGNQDIVLKKIDPVRVAEMTATAATFEPVSIGPTIRGLYPKLMHSLGTAGISPTGYGIAYYEPVADGSVVIHAGVMVDADPLPDSPFAVVDLPGLPTAATIIHHGPMDHCGSSYQRLAGWIDSHGYRTSGFAREFYLDYDPDNAENGVTELQWPVEKA